MGKQDQGAVTTSVINLKKLRGQSLLLRYLETNFVTAALALGLYQRTMGIDPARRELVGEDPANWVMKMPSTTCEHCGMEIKGTMGAQAAQAAKVSSKGRRSLNKAQRDEDLKLKELYLASKLY